MIKVLSKKTFLFTNPKNAEETCIVKATELAILPDYAKEDKMFQWAKADGDLEVFEVQKEEKLTPAQKAAETKAIKAAEKAATEEADRLAKEAAEKAAIEAAEATAKEAEELKKVAEAPEKEK